MSKVVRIPAVRFRDFLQEIEARDARRTRWMPPWREGDFRRVQDAVRRHTGVLISPTQAAQFWSGHVAAFGQVPTDAQLDTVLRSILQRYG